MDACLLALPQKSLEDFCLRHHVRKLSLFGSALTGRFGPDSDVDLLVEFEPGHVPGYFGLVGMEMELTEIVGRKADLRTPRELSPYFRDHVVNDAAVLYERQ